MLRAALLLSLLASQAVMAGQDSICACGKHLLPKITNEKPGRKYARDRLVDILHLKLDVTPDFEMRTVKGTSTLTFKPIATPLTKLELDAVGLVIEDVQTSNALLAEYAVTDEKLVLVFKNPVPVDAEAGVVIRYRAQPERGLYFRTPETGCKPGDTQVWTQGEAELHRYWFPCYDYPNERFTSEVVCHIPADMKAISNGVLVSNNQKDAAGLTLWHWRQNQPHVNYLVALAAGYFHTLEGKAGTVPLALHVPPSETAQAANAFRDTAKIIPFLERETGTPFPWDKYHQVYCLDFIAGGMENTSCTFQAAGLLFQDDTETLSSLHWLDAHEATHQWFGDLVTCRDWSHLWLNEGFATYYTVLYEGERNGPEAFQFGLLREANKVFDRLDSRPIVWRDYKDPMEQFDYRSYPKGAWVLHMIRCRLGEDLFRKAVKTYLDRHRNTVVGTDDLQDVLEEVSGLSFDRFFDQWLYHGGVPELKADYSWDAATKLAKVTVRQTQKVSDQVLLFQFDLPVRFWLKGAEKPVDFKVTVTKAEEDFYFPVPSSPELVRVDPDTTLLTKWDFTPPPDMLKRQLQGDVLGRIYAVQALGKKKDDDSVKQIAEVLNKDAFHGVRSEAAKALKQIMTPAARDALVAGLNQPDARARKAVVEALGAYPHPVAHAALLQQAQREKNPEILAQIINTWGARPAEAAITAELTRLMATPSYHNMVAAAVIGAFRAQGDATAVPLILAKLSSKADVLEFDTGDFAAGMDALAFLARDLKAEEREPVRVFLTSHLSHPKEDLRVAAVQGLGTLRDARSLAVLKPLTTVSKPFKDPVRDAAEKAIVTLNAEQPRPLELKDVWTQMQDLQRKAQEMEKQLETMKKKAEAK
ncbi:M1 family aminopeptidase [Verrucomicrobium sp. BvORR034]|uniref:M1 family aminopeptidase n=1 Tax=Verrucomicrobium sp. BvORR034 TaxID=1396418 RepID=UPI0006789779|nr:M1 family aminopeptidase [Verrucomicrobium sp. BvORR034]